MTRSWWNKYDVYPIVPAVNDGEQTLVTFSGCVGSVFPKNSELASLPNDVRWRIGPKDAQCKKMTATLAEPCAGDQTCTLNCFDHEPPAYFNRIQACVSEKCLKDLTLITI